MNHNKIRNEILEAHNAYRELHSSAPLKYSKQLEESAQAWATRLSQWQILAYSPENNVFSENVAEVRNPLNLKGSQIVDAWYRQQENYDYENLNHTGPTDQFAVMIWNNSQNMGVGIYESIDSRIFIVIQYSPPGLLVDGFQQNVRPPKNYTTKDNLKPKKIVPRSSGNCKVLKNMDIKNFQEDTLKKINEFRLQHGSPPLILNEELCKSATAQAKYCASNNALIKQTDNKFGQTFLELLKLDFIITGGLAPRHWYAESIGYDYTKQPQTDQYNNFTQLVWMDSKEVGIGVAASLKGVLYIIGNFLPKGNIENKYTENILNTKEKTQLCPCGCGYTAPACIQDLTTTILSKVPTYVSHVSEATKDILTNRTFTVLSGDQANVNTKPYALQTQEITVLREDSRLSQKGLRSKKDVSEITKSTRNISQRSIRKVENSQMSLKLPAPISVTTSKNNAILKQDSRVYDLSQSKMSTVPKPSLNLDFKKLKDKFLESHNKYRELHNVPPLEYSIELENTAQNWSETLAVVLILTYSPESTVYSENCAEVRNPFEFEAEEVTDLWYSQQKNYDYENLIHSGPVDQFCVMIWKDSRKVGFGISVSNDQRVFVVAHYSPAGLHSNYQTNVLPPKGYQKPSVPTTPFVPVETTAKSYKGIKKEELNEFHADALGKLNNFRLRHNSPALKLNDELCKSALDQAKRSATNQMLLTTNDPKYGETFLELTIKNFSITGGLASRHWYAESVGYVYNSEPKNDQYHNFTQLIWKNSKEMGIGVAASLQGVLYVIGHYTPPGNKSTQYLQNVLESKEGNKFCACGCGYVAPACIQDLNTTIISKIPSMLTTQRSKTSRFGNSVRSFSILDNSKMERELKNKIPTASRDDKSLNITQSLINPLDSVARDASSKVVMPSVRSKATHSLAPSVTDQGIKPKDTVTNTQNRSMRSIVETTHSKETDASIHKSVTNKQESIQQPSRSINQNPTSVAKSVMSQQPSQITENPKSVVKSVVSQQPSQITENPKSVVKSVVSKQPSQITENPKSVVKSVVSKQPSQIAENPQSVAKSVMSQQPSQITQNPQSVAKSVVSQQPSQITQNPQSVAKSVVSQQPSQINPPSVANVSQAPYPSKSESKVMGTKVSKSVISESKTAGMKSTTQADVNRSTVESQIPRDTVKSQATSVDASETKTLTKSQAKK